MIGGFIAPSSARSRHAPRCSARWRECRSRLSRCDPHSRCFNPLIGIVCFAIILVELVWWRALLPRIPAGLIAIGVGVVHGMGIDRIRSTARWHEHGEPHPIAVARSASRFHYPRSATFSPALNFSVSILVTAIPFGIYDLVEALDNVESAAVAGDEYPTTRVLTADGVVSLIGCLMGNPFINAVYIGHCPAGRPWVAASATPPRRV